MLQGGCAGNGAHRFRTCFTFHFSRRSFTSGTAKPGRESATDTKLCMLRFNHKT